MIHKNDKLNQKCKHITGLIISDTTLVEENELAALDQYLNMLSTGTPAKASKTDLIHVGLALNKAFINQQKFSILQPL